MGSLNREHLFLPHEQVRVALKGEPRGRVCKRAQTASGESPRGSTMSKHPKASSTGLGGRHDIITALHRLVENVSQCYLANAILSESEVGKA